MALALMVVIVLALMFVGVLYTTHLGSGSLREPSKWVYDGVLVAATVLCALRAIAVRRERVAWSLMALALASWTAGEVIWDCVYGSSSNPPIPSISDGFWLAFYPLAAASLVALGRLRLRNLSATAWLDAATGALGVAAVSAAVIFDTVLRSTHGSFRVVATGLAYPVGDLALLSIVVLVSIASGRRLFRQSWMGMVAGLLVFYAADSVYLVQTANNSYHQYGPLDIGWPLGIALIASAAWMPFRKNPEPAEDQPGVVVAVGFGMLGLGVLIVDHFRPTNLLALVLASGCVVSVGVGLVFAFRYREAADAATRARDEAIEASNAKSMFVATVSHELRTPLNGVLGMSDLLLETELTAQQREYAEIVRTSSEGLLAIINDILDYSKIEAGKLAVVSADFSLRETIAEACAMVLVAARGKGIEVNVLSDPELPAWLNGDASRIRQVVINLVSNAVKFTNKGSVTVRVNEAPLEDATRVRVEVTDTGIGIDERSLEHLFEPFTQADGTHAREYGGTGLGLTISAQLVETMGGTIGAHSQPGQGSTFWFELDLPPAAGPMPPTANAASEDVLPTVASERPATTTPPATSDSAPLVLVAEDAPVNQAVAVALLKRCGYRAHVVNNGREALAAIATTSFEAVLMDCQMPVMDGYQATREIRRSEYDDRHLPIIALTAHSMAGDEQKCRAAGMDDYLSKPLREQVLRAVLARVLGETAPSADAAAAPPGAAPVDTPASIS
jgi:signal transduction histidine kinase/ActR/RegA family two-component response regulator